jgi:hypothetical protein
MKVSHGAMFAVIGWMLMVPRFAGITKQDEKSGLAAPIHEWLVINTFDSGDKCRAQTAKMSSHASQQREKSDAELLKSNNSFKTAAEARLWLMSRAHATCIASDDPRLKSN